MGIVVLLKDVTDALEMASSGIDNILDLETGEIIALTSDDQLALDSENTEFTPEWQVEHLEKIRKLLNSEKAVYLPGSTDIHEWSIMEEFCLSITNTNQRELLLDSIHGKGAFQRFREALERFALRDEWFAFRETAFRNIAVDWLEGNKITYKE
jgi:hypothetical protein